MELRHLRYCLAVAEEEHFGRAAKRLHISQPPLSRQIRDLEEELGVVLFERGRHGAQLTAAGAEFVDGIRRILGDLEALQKRVQRVHTGEVGTLRIGYSQSASTMLVRLLSRFRAAFPDVRLYLQEMFASEQAPALLRKEIDVAMGYRLPALSHEEIEATLLQEDEIFWAVPESLKEAAMSSIEVLGELPLLFLPRSAAPALHSAALEKMASLGVHPKEIRELRSVRSVLTLIGCGEGFGLIPGSIVGQGHPGVSFLARPSFSLAMGTYAFVHKATPITETLLQLALSSETREEPPQTTEEEK